MINLKINVLLALLVSSAVPLYASEESPERLRDKLQYVADTFEKTDKLIANNSESISALERRLKVIERKLGGVVEFSAVSGESTMKLGSDSASLKPYRYID